MAKNHLMINYLSQCHVPFSPLFVYKSAFYLNGLWTCPSISPLYQSQSKLHSIKRFVRQNFVQLICYYYSILQSVRYTSLVKAKIHVIYMTKSHLANLQDRIFAIDRLL